MKRFIQTILIAIVVMASGMPAMAQADNNQKLSREELATKQAQYIAREMALDKSTTEKYVKTYGEFHHDIWALGPHKQLTTEQRLERSQQILDLRKKYYKIYRSFLTEEQVDKANRLEKRLLNRMAKNRANHRMPRHNR